MENGNATEVRNMNKHVECRYGDAIPRMEEKINQIHSILLGNGNEGLISKVSKNTKIRYVVIGVGATVSTAAFVALIMTVI